MVMGLALFRVAGLAAAIFYAVHHILAMTTLFLVGGLIEHVGGSSRMGELGNMVRTRAGRGRAVPRPRAEPRRHPAAVGVRAQVRAGRGRASPTAQYVVVAVSLLGQPADPVLGDEDLDRRVLEPGDRGADRARSHVRRPARWTAADGRCRPPCCSRSASPSPSPPGRCTAVRARRRRPARPAELHRGGARIDDG